MSMQQHQDDCPGCRPVLCDADTKIPLPADSPQMQAINRIWLTTTLEEREAFHRVTCQNSRADQDMTLVQGIVEQINAELSKIPEIVH